MPEERRQYIRHHLQSNNSNIFKAYMKILLLLKNIDLTSTENVSPSTDALTQYFPKF